MDAHRVYVLYGADHDDVICEVAHDLELELLPARDALFDEGAPHGASVEAVDDGAAKVAVVGGGGASLPPRVKLGRIMSGKPISAASSSASARLRTVRLGVRSGRFGAWPGRRACGPRLCGSTGWTLPGARRLSRRERPPR